MLAKKYRFIYLTIFLMIIIFSSSANIYAFDINLDMIMQPRHVRMHIYGSKQELYQNWYLEPGIYAEGYLAQPEKFRIQPDPLTISCKRDSHTAGVGYFRPHWGTEHFKSIMLSGNAPALPGIYYSGSLFGVTYEQFAVNLGQDRGDFFGHRLQRELWGRVQLGLKETVIYSDTFPGYWLNYIPFYPYYLLKYIPGFDSTGIDNMNIGLDLTVNLRENIELYGDIHVTEWPLLPESKQPPTYGIQYGLYYENPTHHDINFKMEYQRLMNYLYSARTPAQYYQYQGYALGSELGPDVEQIKAVLNYPVYDNFTITGGVKYTRKGEGEIGDYWTNTDEAHDNLFLSGIIEERVTPVAGFSYQLRPDVLFKLNLEVASIKNFQHKIGNDKTQIAASGQIGLEF